MSARHCIEACQLKEKSYLCCMHSDYERIVMELVQLRKLASYVIRSNFFSLGVELMRR